MRTLVFNGWAAGPETWELCTFRHDYVFDYLEQLDGMPEKVSGLVLVSATPRMMECPEEGWKGMSLRRRAALKLGTQLVFRNDPSPLYEEHNFVRVSQVIRSERKMMKKCVVSAVVFGMSVWGSFVSQAATGPWDADVSDFSRLSGETGDSARIMRAVAAVGKGGVVWFPRGEYEIDSMLVVSNQASLLMHKSAHLKAVKDMPYVLEYFGRCFDDYGNVNGASDHNLFIKGGDIDGAGLASCAHVMGVRHITMSDSTFRSGRKFGLKFGESGLPRGTAGGYEIVANNLYFICNKPGLAGNVGLCTEIGDSHFTDIVVIDYTVGIRDLKWSNRFTRCHIWGGIVKKTGTKDPEYLPDSIAFDLQGDDAVLTDCYADTAMTGFNVCKGTRVFNCSYYNNWIFRMDNPTVFRHQAGPLVVTGGRFSKNSPHATLYARGDEGKRRHLIWNDNSLQNFTAEEKKQLYDELKKHDLSNTAAKSAPKLSD